MEPRLLAAEGARPQRDPSEPEVGRELVRLHSDPWEGLDYWIGRDPSRSGSSPWTKSCDDVFSFSSEQGRVSPHPA